MKRNKRNKKNKKWSLIVLGILIGLMIAFLALIAFYFVYSYDTDAEEINTPVTETSSNEEPVFDNFYVKFFKEAGNGDSILVCNDACMLIDAGHNSDGPAIVKNLKDLGVKELKYLVGTHPHEDHIGGLDDVILSNITVGEVMMPDKTADTKTFRDVLLAIQEKNLEINVPEPGETYSLGDDSFTILGPISPDESANNNSIVILYEHHCDDGTSVSTFLFAGDAESKEEKEILASGRLKRVDVLKVGHHGSSTSTTKEWIDILNPGVAVIMCEEGNKYGHPHKETLDILNRYNVLTLRTDTNGTVTVRTDEHGGVYYDTER